MGPHSRQARAACVEAVAHKVALEQVFLTVFRFSLVTIIPPTLHTHIHLQIYSQKDKQECETLEH
jgi:hypothetical protein